VWSNIHYGYVGIIDGFDAETLQDGAAKVGITDASDRLMIQVGIDLAARVGPSQLTPRDVSDAFLAVLPQLAYYVRINEASQLIKEG
jgi:hypothetical protein